MHKILILVVALFTGSTETLAFTDPPIAHNKCMRRNRDLRDAYQFHNNVNTACAEQMQKSKDACSADPSVSNDDLNTANDATDGDGNDPGSEAKVQGAAASWTSTAEIHRMKKKKYDGRASLCRDEADKVKTACADYIDRRGGPTDLIKALNSAADCDGGSAAAEEQEAAHADVIAASISDGSPEPTGPGTEKPNPYQFTNDQEGRGLQKTPVSLEGVSAEDIERAQATGGPGTTLNLADSASDSKLAEATKTAAEYSKPLTGAWGGLAAAGVSAYNGDLSGAGTSLAGTAIETAATDAIKAYGPEAFAAGEGVVAPILLVGSAVISPTQMGTGDAPLDNPKRAIKLMEP